MQKRVALIEEMETLTKGKEQLTEEENTRFGEIESEIKEVDESIRKAEELIKLKASIPGPTPPEEVEEVKKIKKDYRLGHAILKFAERGKGGPWDGLEKEMHEEGIKQNKDAGVGFDSYEGFLVPTNLGVSDPETRAQATLQATVTAAGGAAVATDLLGLIESLRNEMIITRAGAKILDGLEGNVSIPRRSTESIAYWVSEGGVVTKADPAYESVTLAPHRLSAYTRFSRQFLRQSSFSVEVEVRDVLNYAMRQELEQTAFDGSNSSNQPDGIFNNSSVNNADHGSNGTVINWNNIVTLESMVGADNALRGNLAYITNSTMGGYMKTLTKTDYQGGFLWENFTPLAGGEGLVNGYKAYTTNVLSNALTKGTGTGLSPIVFGNWSELMMGVWGAQEFIIDPYSRVTYDEINVVTVGYFDYALRHPESFATIEAGETS